MDRPKVQVPLPVVESGCCCGLETCCKIQGYFILIYSIYSIVKHVEDILSNPLSCGDTSLLEMWPLNCSELPYASRGDAYHWIVAGFDFIGVLLDLLTFTVTALFLKGIRQRKSAFVSHYVHLMLFHVTVNTILTIFLAIYMQSFLFFIIFFPLSSGIPFYMAVCGNSLQLKILQETRDNIELPAVHPPPGYAPPGPANAPPGPWYAPPGPANATPGPGYAPFGPGYVPPWPGYVPPWPGYVPPGPGYVPPGPGYAPPGYGYAPPGYAPPGYTPPPPGFAPGYGLQDLDGSKPTIV